MRHGKKFNHLGRTASHRKAMLSNMAKSLLEHKRISTTLAKAKELRKYIEPLITKAKEDSTHNRRVAFGYLKNKEAIKLLFGEVVEKVGNRPGGYTRIIKTGYRLGDNAEMCIIELVDFNELMLKEEQPVKKAGRRRSRRGSGKGSESAGTGVATAETTEASESKSTEAEVVEEVSSETPESETPEAAASDEPKAGEEEDSGDKEDDKKSE
jgi:large subunit ribosomal protein L17